MSSATALPELPCATCGDRAAGVCNVLLSQPMSEPYCARCLREGYESWHVIVGTVYCCVDPEHPEDWRWMMADWAVEIIDRSLAFLGRTEAELLEAVRAA